MKNMTDEELNELLRQLDDDIAVPLEVQAGWRKAVRKEAERQKKVRRLLNLALPAAAFVLIAGVAVYSFAGKGTQKQNTNAEKANTLKMAAVESPVMYLESDGEESGFSSFSIAEDSAECMDRLSAELAFNGNVELILNTLDETNRAHGAYFAEETYSTDGKLFIGTIEIEASQAETYVQALREAFSGMDCELLREDMSEELAVLESELAIVKKNADPNDYEIQEKIGSIEGQIEEVKNGCRYAHITIRIEDN